MGLASHIIRAIDRLYLPPINCVLSRQMFRYAVCGSANMLWDLFLYFVIYNFVLAHRNVDLGVVVISSYIASLLIVFPITFFNGYWLNRFVAFRHSPLTGRMQLFRYALSVGGALLLTYGCQKFLVGVLGLWPTPAKALTTAVSVIYSYTAAKYFTFRHADAE